VARVAGVWRFPAVADCVGASTAPPFDDTWKRWWARLPTDSPDFAWMPPWPHGPYEVALERADEGPSVGHPLGVDAQGRDLLSRLLHGTRASVGAGAVAVALGMLVGVLLGGWAGLRRGYADALVLRLIEVFLCFPSLLLLMFGAAFFGGSWSALIVVMAAAFWTSFARVVRGQVLSLRERDYVRVARGLGVGRVRILTRHLWPQLRGQVAVTAAFCLGSAIAAESTLSFLGIGPGAAGVSWGTILRQGSERVHAAGWHAWVIPAAVIASAVLICHRLTERDNRVGSGGANAVS
jgi:peptide/nickel transport system permease protein